MRSDSERSERRVPAELPSGNPDSHHAWSPATGRTPRLTMRARRLAFALVLATPLIILSGCGGGTSSGNASVTAHYDTAAVAKWGWNPQPNPLPSLVCTDNSYANAIKNGVTSGIESAAPYSYIDPKTKQAAGIDVDIVNTALNLIGVTKLKTVVLPFDSLIPALLSNRIDIMAADVHATQARVAEVAFSGPAWWYGPAMVVQKGNPSHITSYADLLKPSVTVGTIDGSVNQDYLTSVHAPHVTTFKDYDTEFTALEARRFPVALEDPITTASFIKANPSSNLQLVQAPVPSAFITTLGFSYARYAFRKQDCQLNAAFSRALAEMRANGVVLNILRSFGLNQSYVNIPTH